jgi:hypothetical protein
VRGGRPSVPSGQAPATVIHCPHGVAKDAEGNVVNLFLHGRDCIGEEPSKRQLSAITGVHRDKVAKLVAPHDPQKIAPEPSLNGSGPA